MSQGFAPWTPRLVVRAWGFSHRRKRSCGRPGLAREHAAIPSTCACALSSSESMAIYLRGQDTLAGTKPFILPSETSAGISYTTVETSARPEGRYVPAPPTKPSRAACSRTNIPPAPHISGRLTYTCALPRSRTMSAKNCVPRGEDVGWGPARQSQGLSIEPRTFSFHHEGGEGGGPVASWLKRQV
jgi:hypothetical protein